MNEKMKYLQNVTVNDERFLEFLKHQAEAASDEHAQIQNGPHPSEDLLHDYVSGILEEDDHEMVVSHISMCAACAKHALTLSVVQAEMEEEIIAWADGERLVDRIWSRMSVLSTVFQFGDANKTAAFGLAMTCLLLLVLIPVVRHAPDLRNMIDETYQIAQAYDMAHEAKLPWERPSHLLSFASSRPTDASRAFGAGLLTGRQTLVKSGQLPKMPGFLSPTWPEGDAPIDKWTETPQSIYYVMGRWAILLRAACLSETEISYEFWENQDAIIREIEKAFSKTEDRTEDDIRIVNSTLGKIREILAQSDLKSFGRTQRRLIAREIDTLFEQCGPGFDPDA